jgi:hypothetical protein
MMLRKWFAEIAKNILPLVEGKPSSVARALGRTGLRVPSFVVRYGHVRCTEGSSPGSSNTFANLLPI